MHGNDEKLNLSILLLLILILVGLPLGIQEYDRSSRPDNLPAGAREFTLTGNARLGWIRGEVRAFDVISRRSRTGPPGKPRIEVHKGDLVVFKLKSSDVVHGFSLKDLGVFITDGIQPGKVVWVSFKADKAGTFTFSCNAVCGDNHENMQGTLVVKA